MKKKFVGIRMYSDDAHKLKVWAAQTQKPIGDLIRDILVFFEQQKQKKEDEQ